MNNVVPSDQDRKRSPLSSSFERIRPYLPVIALSAILLLAATLRLTGLNWDEFTHLHPDERFLTMVETSMQLPSSIGEYFSTETSKLNPHNVGHGFFVYGTFPVFLVRYIAEWTEQTGYDQVHLIGRAVSAAFDVLSVLIVYFIAQELYRKRVALLAALFSALSVLLIQHAHFFVVDAIANTFILAGLYFAVRVYKTGQRSDYLLFGLVLGISVASKISAFPLAFVLALAAALFLSKATGEQRNRLGLQALISLFMAAVISLVVFRILQPYAFSGPSFFDVTPNPKWLENMREIFAMNRGDTDAPYALQWADRTRIWFSLKNMVLWGLGLPLGLVAIAGWIWAFVETARASRERHLILVAWTGGYFLWQSIGFTPAMRYQIPVYPTFAILAAWILWRIWDRADSDKGRWRTPLRVSAAALGFLVIAGTFIWAVAFVQIYTEPVTRVAATRWIYSHIPGVVNLTLETDRGSLLEPIPMPETFVLREDNPYETTLQAYYTGDATGFLLPYVKIGSENSRTASITAHVYAQGQDSEQGVTGSFAGAVVAAGGEGLEIRFEQEFPLEVGRPYVLEMDTLDSTQLELAEELQLVLEVDGEESAHALFLPPDQRVLMDGRVGRMAFDAPAEGFLRGLELQLSPVERSPESREIVLRLEVLPTSGGEEPLAAGVFEGELVNNAERRIELRFDEAFPMDEEEHYRLRLRLLQGGAVSMRGSVIISETTWDDGLPLRLQGRDIGGRYTGVNQELYWPDETDDDETGVSDKLERIARTLSEGEYLIITSNRQYGTIPRVPQRYPLTTAYYRTLFDCAPPASVLECGATATPESVDAGLGYDLIRVFESHPSIGPLEINDQFAEEAFTVYDHPKVLIFKKSDSFSREAVISALDRVDTSKAVHVLPKDVGRSSPNLLLQSDQWQAQQEWGTWEDLFPDESLLNRSQVLAVLTWWLLITALGAAAFPLTRALLPGLADRGYPLARVVGLLLLGWGTWMAGSLGVPAGRLLVLGVFVLILVVAGLVAWRDRDALRTFFREHWREVLWVELLALVFFMFDLGIRIGNPDLWHPAKGGEKPMDLSYLTAVLKSRTYPPYDPWFAGGYINYYYFGFILVGMPIKLLGLMPAVAYNIVLPTLFSLLAVAAYSVGYNLVAHRNGIRGSPFRPDPRLAGVLAALMIVVLGNLGTARMFYDGFKQIGFLASGGNASTTLPGLLRAVRGFYRFITLQDVMPYPMDQWYWNPSRSITPGPGEPGPITEFPYFTFLYGDLHAHMISRPLTLLALAWCVSWLLSAVNHDRPRLLSRLTGLAFGALILGSLRPTNTWDFPVYWVFGVAAVIYAAYLRHSGSLEKFGREAILNVPMLMVLAQFLYQPYHRWYGQGYVSVRTWHGSLTPLMDYLTVHGVFLLIFVTWMVWETREWMATTPLSALTQLRPNLGWIAAIGIILISLTGLLFGMGYQIAVVVIPLGVWLSLLILRPGGSVQKKVVLALVGVGLGLTSLVEVIVLEGDIGRMNTVFKFYLQVWELFALSASVAFAWVISDLDRWLPTWRRLWIFSTSAALFLAALYPLAASPAKIQDRMASDAPHTLDGMAFMPYATRHELYASFSLGEDYRAVRWMQDNIEGSPVIVEANVPEYRWGSRYTIYTGLPGVLGWNWHQRQQRIVSGDDKVFSRSEAITDFYLTRSEDEAWDFLQRFDVRFIVQGRLEQIYYGEVRPCSSTPDGLVDCDLRGWPIGMRVPNVAASECEPIDEASGENQLACPTHGLAKFEAMQRHGKITEVFRDGATVIYEVEAE